MAQEVITLQLSQVPMQLQAILTTIHWTSRGFSWGKVHHQIRQLSTYRCGSQQSAVWERMDTSWGMLRTLTKESSETTMRIGLVSFWTSCNLQLRRMSPTGPSAVSSESLMAMEEILALIFWETTCTNSSSRMRHFHKIQSRPSSMVTRRQRAISLTQ